MKLPRGTLTSLFKETGVSTPRLCDYMATRMRPKGPRAMELEKAAKKIGVNCPAALWLLGSSEEIRSRFLNGKRVDDDDNLNPEDVTRLEKERQAITEEMQYFETAKKIADQVIRNEATLDILSATPSLKRAVKALIDSDPRTTKQPKEVEA